MMWDSFRKCQRGNMAMMTAVSMLVVMLGVGAAIDYGSMNERSSNLQNMADAAVLAAAASGEDKHADLSRIAREVIRTHNKEGWSLSVDVRLEDDLLVVDITNQYDPFIMGMMGKDNHALSVTTASPLAGDTPIELALVLDTTDSMAGANMNAMRVAANAMLTDLQDSESDVRVSVVPFGQYVNIGTSHGKPGSRSWIDMRNYGESYQHCWRPRTQIKAPTCRKVGTETYTVWRDGRNMGTRTRDKKECSGGEWRTEPEQCVTKTRDWHGCMGTRTSDAKAAHAAVNGTRLPAAIDEHCGSELMPLSSSFNQMRTKVTSLSTKGSTYLPSGLVWGWRTLTPAAPYTQAVATRAESPKRAMLFMTDGLNNLSRGDGSSNASGVKHRRTSDGGADGLALTRSLCQNINDDEIEIFVVAYQLPGSSRTADVLSDCATTKAHFFEPDNAAQLLRDFREIATMLDSPRLVF